MKKLSKILIVLLIIILVISGSVYIDYYIVKSRGVSPKIAIKKNLNNNLVVYNAPFYKVWYCKTKDSYTIGDYGDKDAICPYEYIYDEEDNYTNKKGFKISNHDLTLISEYYNNDMIESINTKNELSNAIYVSSNYGKTIMKEINSSEIKSNDGSSIVLFPEYKKVNNKYEWVYDNTDYYCMNNKGEIALFNEECGEYYSIKMDEKWCKLYSASTLRYHDEVKKLCK